MARIPYVEEKDHPELAGDIAKIKGGRGGLINIYKLLLHSPTVCMTWFEHIGAIRWKTKLTPRLRELAIVRIAQAAKYGYALQQHVPRIAVPDGVTLEECEANLATSMSEIKTFVAGLSDEGFGNVVTTHTWEERWETLQLVREMGMEVCCGGIIGMGESLEQRAELAAQFAALDPDEVPLNFLDPRPGTPFADLEPVPATDALRTIAAFRLALPRTILRFAGGRELTLGDLGARQGMVGGINAMIVGNYLTTLGRSPQEDLDLLAELSMPVKELSKTL